MINHLYNFQKSINLKFCCKIKIDFGNPYSCESERKFLAADKTCISSSVSIENNTETRIYCICPYTNRACRHIKNIHFYIYLFTISGKKKKKKRND